MENKNIIDTAKEMGYKGESNTEASAWINAVEKGLDLSDEARYERAKQMGFKTDDIYYHGTANKFDRFDTSTIGNNYTYSERSGFFFTKKKRSAENYAHIHSKGEKGHVWSVFLKFETPYTASTDSDYYSPADRFDINGHDMMHDVRLEKKDAIFIKGTRNDDLCVVLDPSQILSIHAAFDLETEFYKPFIDIYEEFNELTLTYSLDKEEGQDELIHLLHSYCEQEENNKTPNEIKNIFFEEIKDVEYKNFDKIKDNLDNIVDSFYAKKEPTKKIIKRKRTKNRIG